MIGWLLGRKNETYSGVQGQPVIAGNVTGTTRPERNNARIERLERALVRLKGVEGAEQKVAMYEAELTLRKAQRTLSEGSA